MAIPLPSFPCNSKLPVLDVIQISARVNFPLPLPKPNDTDRQKMEPTGVYKNYFNVGSSSYKIPRGLLVKVIWICQWATPTRKLTKWFGWQSSTGALTKRTGNIFTVVSTRTYHLPYPTIRRIPMRFNDTVTMEDLEQVSEDGDDELRALSEPDTESDSETPPLIWPESIDGD